jgi:uncharacterized protein YpmS
MKGWDFSIWKWVIIIGAISLAIIYLLSRLALFMVKRRTEKMIVKEYQEADSMTQSEQTN